MSKRRGAKVGVIQWAKGTMRSVASSRSSASTRSTMLASSLASLARHFSSIAKRSAAAMTARWPRLRASRMPHSSKASRTPAILNFSSPSPILSAPPQRARRRGSPSASSSLPPGNTSAPEKASILWWRTTMKTSRAEPASPGCDGRTSSTVVAGRGSGAGRASAGCFFVSFISACISGTPDCPIHVATVPLAGCIVGWSIPQRRRTP